MNNVTDKVVKNPLDGFGGCTYLRDIIDYVNYKYNENIVYKDFVEEYMGDLKKNKKVGEYFLDYIDPDTGIDNIIVITKYGVMLVVGKMSMGFMLEVTDRLLNLEKIYEPDNVTSNNLLNNVQESNMK